MGLERTDIAIAGGGIAGLTAAAAFGAAGFSVIAVDPAPPVTAPEASGADLRTTAILQPGQRLLAEIGLWGRLAPHATPLSVMRILAAGGEAEPKPRDFEARELSDAPFGWNLPNWLLRRELLACLAGLPGVSFRSGLSAAGLLTRESEARVTLSDGSRIAARLIIAADGRASPMREALGIPVHTHRTGQKALAFSVTHPIPHANVSIEIHRSGGPFTLVPLPDRAGRPASAVVWMEPGPEATRLAALPVPDFEAAMTERSLSVLGPLTLASGRSLWPIVGQIAERFDGERAALMAEAAHVVPPIGAQGLNMSLADLASLLDLVRSDPAGLGSPKMLGAYTRARLPDALMRVLGIGALNLASQAGAAPLARAREAALAALHGAAPLRRGLMRLGLGLS
jgi:2-octaprenyl-6-methoxyphenol hydroxylase